MDAIILRGVGKHFRKATVRREYTTLKSEVVRFFKRPAPQSQANQVITALRNVTLSVPRGRTVGLVGRNGSGKSTLLKLVTGIYQPTSGTVEVHGRISALLELGAGFHPDFSGRENIVVNGIILGMSRREIRERMPEIIAFSELGDFIDEPVRTYSSGMYARLAFSVATHVDPDILIIDEILSVGDEHFGRKSAAVMDEFRRAGKTILLVTHDVATLQSRCDEAAWLDGGELRAYGDPQFVVSEYRTAVAESEVQTETAQHLSASHPMSRSPRFGPSPEAGRRWGTFQAELKSISLRAPGGTEHAVFDGETGLEVTLVVVQDAELEAPAVEVSIFSSDGTLLWRGSQSLDAAPETAIVLTFPRLGLGDGNYRLDAAVLAAEGRICCDFQKGLHAFAVRSTHGGVGLLRPVHRWSTGPSRQPSGLPVVGG